MPATTTIDYDDWIAALGKFGGDSASSVAKNPKLAQATFDLLKSVAEGSPLDATADAISLGNEASAKSQLGKKTKDVIKATSFVVSEAKLSMSLRVLGIAAEGGKYARVASVGGASALIGATVVTKVGLAIGLAGDDQERAKCIGAIMEVAGNVGVTALTWETGAGAILGVIAITASTVSAYNECK